MSNDVDSFSGTWSGGVTYSLQPNQNAKGFVQVLWVCLQKENQKNHQDRWKTRWWFSDSNRSARSISRMSSKQIWSCMMSVTWKTWPNNLTETKPHFNSPAFSKPPRTQHQVRDSGQQTPGPRIFKTVQVCPSHFCKASGFGRCFWLISDSFQWCWAEDWIEQFRHVCGSSANLWTPTLLSYRHGDLILLWCANRISFPAPRKLARVHRLRSDHRSLCKIWPCSVLLLTFQSSKKSCISHCQKRFVMLKQDACQQRKYWQPQFLPGKIQVSLIVYFILWIHILSKSHHINVNQRIKIILNINNNSSSLRHFNGIL